MARDRKDKEYVDLSIPNLLQKRAPDSLTMLREELQKQQNFDIMLAAQKTATFEEALGVIAAHLDIALDGSYDAEELCRMLFNALKNRGKHSVNPDKRAPGLIPIEMVERADRIDLLPTADKEMLETAKKLSPPDQAPYTICDDCKVSFDCILARTCQLGKPATQLPDLKKLADTVNRRNLQ